MAVLALAGVFLPACAKPTRAQPDAWQSAVTARAQFEAQPAHTRDDYGRIMDAFRAIYHANPSDLHAAASIAQVATLLAEQGRELADAKSLKDATAQCEFLAKQYPMSIAVKSCLPEIKLAAARPLPPKSDPAPSARDAKPTVIATATHEDTTATDAPPTSDIATPTKRSTKATVTGIRHWSTPTYTRVAIDLGDDVQYQAARVEHPDRIFFDLHHARLAQELVGKSFSITDDGFLTKIRAAQYSDDVTRVVLDVHEVAEYSAFLLPNPYRLIIDIHGKQPGREAAKSAPPTKTNPEESTHASEIHSAEMRAADTPLMVPPSSTDAEAGVSKLPPMPVTDGSASFGLPSKTSTTNQAKTTAPPRVVIPVRPTQSKPVPNTVTSRSASTGTDVAAVSEQPGKVEATSRPTSSPITSRTKNKTIAAKQDAEDDAPPAPSQAAPPTAAGATSLVRALGLKIGRIVIDAGHGGHDSGTLGADGIQEKDVVLDVALRLGKLLHQRLGAEIVYTRADDTFIPLETRTAIANKAQADLFISIHANSSQDTTARGVEVYYLNFTSDPEAMRVAGRENAVSTQSVHELSDLVKKIALKDKIDESRELAADVDASLYSGLHKATETNTTLKDRGVKKAPFVVLIGANMPSILAEISFVTNPTDAEQLRTPDYRQRVAESLFNGVARYAGAINGVKPATTKAPPLQRVASKR